MERFDKPAKFTLILFLYCSVSILPSTQLFFCIKITKEGFVVAVGSLVRSESLFVFLVQDTHVCRWLDKLSAKLVNKDANDGGIQTFKKNRLCICFMSKEMHSTHFLDLEDTHAVFW